MNKQLLNFYRKIYQTSLDKYNLALADYNTSLNAYLNYVYEYNRISDLLEKRCDMAFKLVIKRYCDMKSCEKQYYDAKGGLYE